MHPKTINLLLVVALSCILLPKIDAWWLVGKNGNNRQCPWRRSADPYYFGDTNMRCLGKGKRSVPSRGVWELTHRVIYYKGYYFEFLDNSKAYIGKNRFAHDRCPGGLESSAAGYSELSLECIKGCARNYRCKYGYYTLLGNNCNVFANRISAVLCASGGHCPSWCRGNCNDAEEH
ncbi:uncharacterized protein LOC128180105 [Crassostrea angulata]|uniref:uncharacterized protein LOC128180105 n=1 Tax=Magallana angulata TaxID=2784310 RepID=UPI0022B1BD7D|nr:uncharacterized protein LOC128180105 [Crassostrea angulata]